MQDFLFIKDGNYHFQVAIKDIVYVEAIGRYVRVVTTGNKSHTTRCYLSQIETLLPHEDFCRIHRSYIVALKHVEFFSAAEVTIAKQALPIGRHYRDGLREK